MAHVIRQSPAALETAFYDAFARLDLRLMATIWLPGHRAVCIHPGGQMLRGADAVLESWRHIFDGAEPPIVEHRLIDAFAAADLAVHLVEEAIRPRTTSTERANRLIATNVYVLEHGLWYLAEHHGSLPLVRPPRGETPREKPRLH